MVDTLEQKLCDYFGVDKETLIGKNSFRQASLARGYLWYILHYEHEWSINKIAKRYERNIRTINRGVARIKYVITTQKLYKEQYEKMQKAVRF